MSNENVAINAFMTLLNAIIKCFEIYKAKLDAKVSKITQELEHFKGSDEEKQKKVNELEKAKKELEAVNGALDYLNDLKDDAKAQIVVNTIQEIATTDGAKDKGWINDNGKLTDKGLDELIDRIADKALDSQKGLTAEQKKSIHAQIQEATKKSVQISKTHIHEVTPETYQELTRIAGENSNPEQYFSSNNINNAINNIRANGNPKILKELFDIQEKLTKGEPVTHNDKRVQSDLIPAHAEAEHTQ